MILSKYPSIEDLVIKHLRGGPIDTTRLITLVEKERANTTKQGVYAALRKLVKEEVVSTHNKQSSLNLRWLKNMNEFFTVAQQHYVGSSARKGNFLDLREKEKISYTFASPAKTDLFWWDALYILSESSPPSEPVYLYNPHEWFLIAREESEREAIRLISARHRFLLTAGGNTLLDRSVKKEFDGNMSQYHMLPKPLFTKNNYYFNIVGDFLIEVWIDKKIADAIERYYLQATNLDERALTELMAIVTGKGRSKLTISRDKKKATLLKRVLGKNFYLPYKETP